MLRSLAAALLLAVPAAAQQVDDTPRIAVMSAYAPEWVLLQEALGDAEEQTINGNRFLTGTIEGQQVVLFLSGISMVNAAMTTQLALDHFEIEGIVFSGIAGGIDPDLSIGDVVVAEQWGQYMDAVFARETEAGFTLPAWMSSDFPNYGMIFTRPVQIQTARAEEPDAVFWFPTDPTWFETARSAVQDINLVECNAENACLSDAPKIVVGGNGVSGSVFVGNASFRSWVFDTFDARVLDMERAAVAHVAYANEVPFIAFRSLSDLAGGGEGENEIGTFFGLAADNSVAVVRAFLAHLEW